MLRRRDEFSLFTAVDAFGAAGETRMRPVTHLDKHQGLAVIHDQVDFTVAATVVAFPRFAALRQQITPSPFFLLAAFLARRRASVHCGAAGGKSLGTPLLKRAHNGARCIRLLASKVKRPVAPENSS